MSGDSFVPLRVRSHGSLLFGTASPEALIERALGLGYPSLALTDRDNLYLAFRFYKGAHDEGLRPLIGAEISQGPHHALLLPVDRRGYANLCRVLTLRHLEPGFDLVQALGDHSDGLHVVVESSGLARSLLAAGVRRARGHDGLARGADVAAVGGLWMGVRGLPVEIARLGERAAVARWLQLPMVATGDCVMLERGDHLAHRVAVTAAAGELLDRMTEESFCSPDAWLAAPAEWVRRVRGVCGRAGMPELAREALANNAALAARCRLELELGTPIFPHAPVPAGETGPGYLLRLGLEGVERRYGMRRDGNGSDPGRAPAGTRGAVSRLRQELAIIERLGFTDYFLLVADIVEFARARGIPTVGRGSGAGSIVAYCLGITNVDPLRYGLYFERFLHPARRDCPDLDIDLCWRRRDEVIQHVYDTYGAEQVAMISTHATLGARSAFRETAKALGVPNARVNTLAKHVPHEMEKPYLEQLRGPIDWRDPVLARALRLAETLDGAPRHLSIHCGGLVIGDRPLTYYVPMERAAKGIVVTQFEMRAIEAIGLVKMDLLGNRALTTIGDCVELARRRGAAVDIERIPEPDPETAARISSGDTLNCFQLESPAMRHLLRMLRARTLDDTIAAVALVRPGPAQSGMKEAFCRRQRGLESAAFLHPRLAPVLSRTHGVMLYEEDVMSVAAAITGLSLAEGDQLRRAIGAADGDEEKASLERGFVAQARAAGVDAVTAAAVWRELMRFGSYAFCKAHAAGYGALAYQCTWLKAHFPTEFAVAILNHHAGMYATWVHVEDLRRHGVRFLPPCVLRSSWDSTLEMREARVGLGRVFGLTQATGERIVAARPDRPFRSLADFIDRARPTLPEVESLVLAGALDFTGRTRPSMLLEARAGAGAWSASAAGARSTAGAAGNGRASKRWAGERPVGLVDVEPRAPFPVPALPEFGAADQVRGEMQATGLWFSGHPLELLIPASARSDAVAAASLPENVGRQVTVVGIPCAYRRVETKKGEPMLFLTLADQTGLAEAVLFPDAYRAHAGTIPGRVVRAAGRVDETLDAFTLTTERLETLA